MRRDVGVVIAAGGSGIRIGKEKQFLILAGRPVLQRCLDVFASLDDVAEVVVVCPADKCREGERVVGAWRSERQDFSVRVVEGGRRRQDSVRRGLEALTASRYVLVHDAARPLVLPSDVESLVAKIRETGAAAIGTRCSDSLKRVVDGVISAEIDRDGVWAVQTPQGAEIDRLRAAYAKADNEVEWTDEASLLRAAGVPVSLVKGSSGNMKITDPGDEVLVETILRGREAGFAD